jgi:hypothetical protein
MSYLCHVFVCQNCIWPKLRTAKVRKILVLWQEKFVNKNWAEVNNPAAGNPAGKGPDYCPEGL